MPVSMLLYIYRWFYYCFLGGLLPRFFKATKQRTIALDKVGTKHLCLLQLGGCLSGTGVEKSPSSLLSCSHLSQVVYGTSEVSEDTCVTKGPAESLQMLRSSPHRRFFAVVRSYSLLPQ